MSGGSGSYFYELEYENGIITQLKIENVK